MKMIKEVKGLKANGHYALAVIEDKHVYLSGQFSVNPKNGEQIHGTLEEELRQVLDNVDLILKEAGTDKNKVIKTTLFVKNLEDWPIADQVYGKYFGDHTPARSIVTVADLHYGYQVEMEVIAKL